MLASDSPDDYNCERCIALGKQNKVRGRDCLLKRNLKKAPLTYSFKNRNSPEVRGVVTSEQEFFEAIDLAFEVHKTNDIEIALRRIGKGVCPKSFPLTRQSYYFLDIYAKTHGGEYGTDLTFLPNSGGILDQPNIFYAASSVISSIRSAFFRKRLDESKNKNTGNSNSGRGIHQEKAGPGRG